MMNDLSTQDFSKERHFFIIGNGKYIFTKCNDVSQLGDIAKYADYASGWTKPKVIQESVVSIHLFDLDSEKYILKFPINILVKYQDDEVIAIFPELEIFGEGQNEIEAIDDLKSEFLDLIDDLNELPKHKMGQKLNTWNRVLSQIVEEK